MTFLQQIKEMVRESAFCRFLIRVSDKLGEFFASGNIYKWFFKSPSPDGKGRCDRLMAAFVDSRFCDFIRSSKILELISRIPQLPWVMLMLTLLSALVLPTLAVMMLSLLTLLTTFVSLVFEKEKCPAFSGGVCAWGLFALLTLIYTFVNYGGLRGMLSGGIRFCMLPLMPCAWILLSQKERIWKTLYVFGGGTLTIGVYGLYQFFAGTMSSNWTDTELFSEDFGRLTSTFENPNVYGTFLLIAVPLMLVAAIFARGKGGKIFFGLVSFIALLNLALTYSRGCYVSLVLVLLILLICHGKAWMWAGVGAVAASPLYLPQSVMDRVLSIGNLADTSVSYRISIWKGAWKLIENYWWMGVGIGDAAFESVYGSVALEGIDAPHAHNLFLQIVCESGILSLIVLMAMFLLLFRTSISRACRESGAAKWLRTALICAWIGLLVQGFTDYIFYNNNLFAIMMISLGGMISGGKEKDEQ